MKSCPAPITTKRTKIGHDHHAKRVAATREVRFGDLQRDADPGLTVAVTKEIRFGDRQRDADPGLTVAVAREVRFGDRQRDADPGLTVELPVVRQAQQREASQQNAHRPD